MGSSVIILLNIIGILILFTPSIVFADDSDDEITVTADPSVINIVIEDDDGIDGYRVYSATDSKGSLNLEKEEDLTCPLTYTVKLAGDEHSKHPHKLYYDECGEGQDKNVGWFIVQGSFPQSVIENYYLHPDEDPDTIGGGTNSYKVVVNRVSTDVDIEVTAKALCAQINFPMNMMVGGVLLDIDTWSLFIANIGVNPVITGLVGITLVGVAGQIIWFIHKRK